MSDAPKFRCLTCDVEWAKAEGKDCWACGSDVGVVGRREAIVSAAELRLAAQSGASDRRMVSVSMGGDK